MQNSGYEQQKDGNTDSLWMSAQIHFTQQIG